VVSRKLQVFVVAAMVFAGVGAVAAPTASAPGPLDEVVVSAKRAQLAPRVSKFVTRIAARENEEGLPRWQDPVCPLVTGLPRQEGEFVLGRLSEIANAAAVPLAGEHCRPNLFIFVTTEPVELLQVMAKKNRAVTFGDATPTTVDQFIATPRPVRVWYNTTMRTPEGTPPRQGMPNAAQVLGGGLQGVHVYNDLDRTSHILLSKIWGFSYVYVIVDQARLQSISRGQFADYVAMVGLADIKPGASLGDAPTILKRVDGAAQAASDGLSDWDQGFLKSLYSTDQRTKTQSDHIANGIVRAVVH
jgi:hypothetical protein